MRLALLELRGWDRQCYCPGDGAGPVMDRCGHRRGPQLELLDLGDQAVHPGLVQLGFQFPAVRHCRRGQLRHPLGGQVAALRAWGKGRPGR